MLTIRREQMQALNDYMQGSLEERLARRLVLKFPDKVKAKPTLTGGSDPQAIVAFVQQGAIKAGEFGISSATDVAAFIDLLIVAEVPEGASPRLSVADFASGDDIEGDLTRWLAWVQGGDLCLIRFRA